MVDRYPDLDWVRVFALWRAVREDEARELYDAYLAELMAPPDGPREPPMGYKAFIAGLDDSVEPEEAQMLYSEYLDWWETPAAEKPKPPTPPPPKEPVCYLVYSSAHEGSLLLCCATGEIKGALAKFKPRKNVDEFASMEGGKSELCRNVGAGGQRYYTGWTYFIKTARSFDGVFTQLMSPKTLPAAIYLHDTSARVSKLELGVSVNFDAVATVAVSSGNGAAFEVPTMEPHIFQQVGEWMGAVLTLDGAKAGAGANGHGAPPVPTGGSGGKKGGTSSRASMRRSFSASTSKARLASAEQRKAEQRRMAEEALAARWEKHLLAAEEAKKAAEEAKRKEVRESTGRGDGETGVDTPPS